MKRLLPFLIGTIAALVASLRFVDQALIDKQQDGISKHIFIFLFDSRLWITFFGTLLASVIAIIDGFYFPRKTLQEIRLMVMAEMLDDLFGGDKVNVRITAFRDASWLRVMWIHYSPFLRHPVKWFSTPKPARPKFEDGRYIRVIDRIGVENKKSRTFFYYDPKSGAKSQGVAGKARQKEGVIVAQRLPDISGIDLHALNMKDNTNPNVNRVKNYMRLGHVDDIETLKRLHRKARHFYGNILLNRNSKPIGVLVIDDMRAPKPFDDVTQSRLEHFIKLLYPTM